jgi:hypothetical protein
LKQAPEFASLATGKLILGCHALDIFRLAFYSVPQPSVGFDRKPLDDAINLRPADHITALRTLQLVTNVLIRLEDS